MHIGARRAVVCGLLPCNSSAVVRVNLCAWRLQQDIASIEAGRVPLPAYPGSAEPLQIQTVRCCH